MWAWPSIHDLRARVGEKTESYLIRLRSRGKEQGCLVTEQVRYAGFEFPSSGIPVQHVITHLSVRYGGAHRLGRHRYGVASEVDDLSRLRAPIPGCRRLRQWPGRLWILTSVAQAPIEPI